MARVRLPMVSYIEKRNRPIDQSWFTHTRALPPLRTRTEFDYCTTAQRHTSTAPRCSYNDWESTRRTHLPHAMMSLVSNFHSFIYAIKLNQFCSARRSCACMIQPSRSNCVGTSKKYCRDSPRTACQKLASASPSPDWSYSTGGTTFRSCNSFGDRVSCRPTRYSGTDLDRERAEGPL